MEHADPFTTLRERKLVVLGIPFDVETEELKYYMRKFGDVEDCVVMKDRLTRQSRGFGYVTFSTVEDARKVVAAQHNLNGRILDVKIATPKDEMVPSASKKVSRIFVARIPPQVTEGAFRSYFQKYGSIVDAYMPKDVGSRTHRGIGFVTFENPESVDKIMNETHELGGSLVAVDRATPKEETLKSWGANPHQEQVGKSFPDQWAKGLPEQWAKGLPEQWAKGLPDQWAKMFPDQLSFYMAAAAAAAAAQMGAFGGMGGSMEGFDFSNYGFPGLPETGAEKLENQWYSAAAAATEGDASKDTVRHTTDSPGGAPKDPSSEAPGYPPPSNVPDVTPPGVNASAAGYGSEAGNLASAYGPAAFLNSMYSMLNPASAYGNGASTTSNPQAGYGGPGAATSACGPYGSVPPVPHYDVANYYGSSAGSMAPTAMPPRQAQPYTFDHEVGGASYPAAGYGSGALYGGGASAPSALGYDSSASYAGAAASLPGSGYGSSAPYAAITHTPGAGYTSNNPYGEASTGYGSTGPPVPTMGNKVFIGKLPHEATAEHLRTYFSQFGRILDVYIPKDPKKSTGHRGFGFVTFFDDGVAERVAMESHEIMGQAIAVDRPTPQESGGNNPSLSNLAGAGSAGAWGGGSAAALQRMAYGGLDNFAGGMGSYNGGQSGSYDGAGADRGSRPDFRYRPY